MSPPQIFIGTADEIAEQIRVNKPRGKLKAILSPNESESQNEPSVRSLTDFLIQLDDIEFSPSDPSSELQETEVNRLIVDKFSRRGHSV